MLDERLSRILEGLAVIDTLSVFIIEDTWNNCEELAGDSLDS